MGVVYKAEDTILQRTVALKFLRKEEIDSDEDKERFLQEAQAAAALDHSNICTVYEISQHDDQHFIAMSYIEGWTLEQIISSAGAKGFSPLPIEKTMFYYGDYYAKSLYMLGKIHEIKNKKRKAIEYYEKFLDLWKDADDGLQEVDDTNKRFAELIGDK